MSGHDDETLDLFPALRICTVQFSAAVNVCLFACTVHTNKYLPICLSTRRRGIMQSSSSMYIYITDLPCTHTGVVTGTLNVPWL